MVRGQMKIQQTVFMLLALMVFFFLIGLFFLVMKFSNLKNTANALQENNAIFLVSKLSNSPEFSCEESFNEKRTNCVDLDKVMALKELSDNYKNFWGVYNIEVKYVSPKNKTICNKLNYPDCGVIKIYNKEDKGIWISDFVALCRKNFENNVPITQCKLGKIMVLNDEK